MFFLKATNSFLATGENIRRPATCDGKLVYEAEFGIVIGKTYANVSEVEVAEKFRLFLHPILASTTSPPANCCRRRPPSTSGRGARALSR